MGRIYSSFYTHIILQMIPCTSSRITPGLIRETLGVHVYYVADTLLFAASLCHPCSATLYMYIDEFLPFALDPRHIGLKPPVHNLV